MRRGEERQESGKRKGRRGVLGKGKQDMEGYTKVREVNRIERKECKRYTACRSSQNARYVSECMIVV